MRELHLCSRDKDVDNLHVGSSTCSEKTIREYDPSSNDDRGCVLVEDVTFEAVKHFVIMSNSCLSRNRMRYYTNLETLKIIS